MISIWYLMIFGLGAAVGSFLNVVVSRMVEGQDWIKGRSHCDYCMHTLGWYELIPILSFVLSGGKSRCCGKQLSYQHPLVEGLMGLLFVWWVALSSAFFLLVTQPGRTAQPLFWLVTGILLLAITIADLYYGVIPLPFVLVGSVLVVGYRLILIGSGTYQVQDLWWSILGMIILAGFYLLLRLITRGRGMGEGDVWLSGYLGLLIGWSRILPATMIAFVVGAVVGIGLIALKLKSRKETIPFGPFMVLGAVVSLFLRL